MSRTYGINFPFRESSVGKYFSLSENKLDEIRSNLLHLILTRKGSRFFLPDFGTRIYEFIFEPMDSLTFSQIESDIYDSVEKYIPNLQINDITIEEFNADEDTINPEDLTQIDDRVFRVADRSAEQYTAKLKIDFTVNDSTFQTKDFIIINI